MPILWRWLPLRQTIHVSHKWNSAHVQEIRCADRYMTVREVAEDIGIPITTCHKILTKDLNMKQWQQNLCPTSWVMTRTIGDCPYIFYANQPSKTDYLLCAQAYSSRGHVSVHIALWLNWKVSCLLLSRGRGVGERILTLVRWEKCLMGWWQKPMIMPPSHHVPGFQKIVSGMLPNLLFSSGLLLLFMLQRLIFLHFSWNMMKSSVYFIAAYMFTHICSLSSSGMLVILSLATC